MPQVSVSFKPSLASVGRALKDIQLGAALQRAIAKYAFGVERYSKIVTPVDTGRLRASIRTDIGNLRAKVAPQTNYAGFVHEGTRFMRGRPFMTWGVMRANERGLGAQGVTAEVESEIKDKLRRIR